MSGGAPDAVLHAVLNLVQRQEELLTMSGGAPDGNGQKEGCTQSHPLI